MVIGGYTVYQFPVLGVDLVNELHVISALFPGVRPTGMLCIINVIIETVRFFYILLF